MNALGGAYKMLLNIILMVSIVMCLAAIVKVAYLKREEKHHLNSSFVETVRYLKTMLKQV